MKTQIVEKANVSRRHLNMLLRAERNATAKTARALELASGIPKEIWVFGSKRERIAEWERMLKQRGER